MKFISYALFALLTACAAQPPVPEKPKALLFIVVTTCDPQDLLYAIATDSSGRSAVVGADESPPPDVTAYLLWAHGTAASKYRLIVGECADL
jgi:hypothetical protein